MTSTPGGEARPAGGSSSGSAALVAAGVCDFALGTDTGGSIRIPAAYCGIVGLKPTFGLVPVEGVFPLSPTCDHVGTLTRTVEQAATLLGVLAGRKYELRPLTGLRLGVLRRQLDDPALVPAVRDRVQRAIALFGTPEGDVEGRYTGPYNLVGNPAVSLPCGLAEGNLPAGLQLAAAFGNDELLLSAARVYEEVGT